MNRGFTLLEIIVAAFVISLVAGGVFSLAVSNLRNVRDIEKHLEAAYLAQEGIELVRNLRDANYLAIRKGLCDPIKNPNAWKGVVVDSASCLGSPVNDLTICASACEAQYDSTSLTVNDRFLLRDGGNGVYNYGSGVQTPFKRKITIDHSATDKLKVDVKVSWEGKSVVASTELYNWLTLSPPARSDATVNGQPNESTLPAGTTSVDLGLTTDQNANCRYSESSGTRYDDIANNTDFTTTGTTAHVATVTTYGGLPFSDGNTYPYYVRCKGEFHNTSVNDFIITFTIANP